MSREMKKKTGARAYDSGVTVGAVSVLTCNPLPLQVNQAYADMQDVLQPYELPGTGPSASRKMGMPRPGLCHHRHLCRASACLTFVACSMFSVSALAALAALTWAGACSSLVWHHPCRKRSQEGERNKSISMGCPWWRRDPCGRRRRSGRDFLVRETLGARGEAIGGVIYERKARMPGLSLMLR